MNCFSEEIIQRFVDGESTERETLMVENHMAGCPECKRKVDYQKQQLIKIKDALNELVGEISEIPKIESFINIKKSRIPLKRKLVYGLVAASVLWMLFIVSNWQQSNCRCDKIIYYSVDLEIDANKPISDQEITVQITDQNGHSIDCENSTF